MSPQGGGPSFRDALDAMREEAQASGVKPQGVQLLEADTLGEGVMGARLGLAVLFTLVVTGAAWYLNAKGGS